MSPNSLLPKSSSRLLSKACGVWLLFGGLTFNALMGGPADEPRVCQVRPSSVVDSSGIYLDQLLVEKSTNAMLHLRLAAAPALGQVASFSLAKLAALVQEQRPDLTVTNYAGAKLIKVMRRMRSLEESELKQMLTTALQRDIIKERGELELRFPRPWLPVPVPDELLTLSILDLPPAGVTGNFIVRFELRCGPELAGTWQWPLQARVWREIWVALSPATVGQLVAKADLARERRDVLTLREAPATLEIDNAALELAENVPAGSPIYGRAIRLRPVIRRGKIVEAIFQDGALTISVKAEALEDGVPGQIVRARNLASKREFRGKVQNEQAILVSL